MNTTSSPASAPAAPRHRATTLRRWEAVVADLASSGLSIREFCRQRGVREQALYLWRGRLSPDQGEPGAAAFVPVVVRAVGPRSSEADDWLQVDLRGGRVLRLPASMPAARVAEVLHALEGQA